MQVPDTARANGRPTPRPRHAGEYSELEELRATCRAQALEIEALGQGVSALRRGVVALEAENAELRAACDRPGSGRPRAGAVVAVRLPCDARAPGAARIVVAERLHDRVAADVLERAQLLVSELVTNSVCHSGAGPKDPVLVRVLLSRTVVRLEVEDAGRGGVIVPRPPDLDNGGGFGLQLVQALSERWGLERVTEGGTIVWAQLPRTPVTVSARSDEPADRGRARSSLTAIDPRAGGHCAAPAEGQS